MDTIRELFEVPELPPGRCAFGVQLIRVQAHGSGDGAVVSACDAAIAAAKTSLQTNLRWETVKAQRVDNKYSPDLLTLDPQIDRVLTAIHDNAATLVRALPASHSLAVDANQFLTLAYPAGVSAYTTLSYPEQSFAVDELLRRCESGDLAHFVETLGIGIFVTELAALNARFKALLPPGSGETLDYAEVVRAREASHRSLLVLIATIICHHAHDAHKLDALLAPILQQIEEVRALRRRRRNVPDIDPQSGLFKAVSIES